MLGIKPKSLIIIFSIVALCTCIDPYKPNLSGYESYLVVEGMITDEAVPYEIKLSRTMKTRDAAPEKITDAVVSINEENGIQTILSNAGNGSYKSSSNVFRGAVGKIYSLHIITKDGKEYVSEPTLMLPVPDIENVYYEKSEIFNNDRSEVNQGIQIYLDSKEGDENNNHLRWEFEETWKFRLPMPKKYNFFNDSTIIPVKPKEFCWRQQKSTEILTHSFAEGQAHIIRKEPLCFIAPEKTDRISVQYSILVKQYSMSKKESEFWENLKKVSESGSDIYGVQPFPVISNIANINDPGERVLGYFHVCAVSQKRKNITFKETIPLELPVFHYNCSRIETSPADFHTTPFHPLLSFQDVFNIYDANPYYSFIEPIYDPETNKLFKLVFTTSLCSDCELTGTLKKPDFWIDLN